MRFLWFLLIFATSVHAAPNVLNNSSHVAGNIRSAITILLGPGILDTSVFVDMTSLDSTFDPSLIADATNGARTNFSSLNNAPVNHAPYIVISNSFGGFGTQAESLDINSYGALNSGGIIDNWAYVPLTTLPISTPPPIDLANVTRSFGAGVTGGGVEFGVSNAYKGFDTSSASATTAGFTGILTALKNLKPTWTWGDIKAALRQTAANWSTGYNRLAYGYGTVDYDAANAIASTASLFLQPPLMTLSAAGNHLTITLYPFRQTRRVNEVVYIVPTSYSWPVKNEYVLADITASGGALVYTSNGTDAIPTTVVTLMQTPGTYYMIAFTSDNVGGYSRVEPFSALPVTVYGSGVTCP